MGQDAWLRSEGIAGLGAEVGLPEPTRLAVSGHTAARQEL